MGKVVESTNIRFLMDKKEIPREMAEKVPILASGGIVGAADAVYAFKDEASFISWAERFPSGEKFLKLHRTIDATRELENRDVSAIKKIRQRRTDFLVKELEDLAKRSDLSVNSTELFLKATCVDCDHLEGSIFDPSIIYQHINYRGSWRPIATTIPDFRWIGFNDKASSMIVSGVGILFEHTWYRGRRFYFGGFPYMNFPDFRQFAFNDLASSVALT